MNQKKINYIFSAVIVVLALILGYFGFTLPVTPEMPSPLPTPDLSDVYIRLQSLETMQGMGGGESFGIRERISIDARDDAYLYSGADMYFYSDDHTTQKFHVDGATGNLDSEGNLDLAGNLDVAGTLAFPGNISSSTGAVTVTDDMVVTGTLAVYGATALDSTLDVDGNISSGTGAVTVTDNLYVTGTMQIIGEISNPTHYITINDHVDIANTLNYGDSNLWPIGSEDSNFQFSWGSETITGTAAVANQKVGSPTAAWCTISAATFTATHCSTLIVGTTVTVSVWLSDSTASPVGVAVDWLVIGIP